MPLIYYELATVVRKNKQHARLYLCKRRPKVDPLVIGALMGTKLKAVRIQCGKKKGGQVVTAKEKLLLSTKDATSRRSSG